MFDRLWTEILQEIWFAFSKQNKLDQNLANEISNH